MNRCCIIPCFSAPHSLFSIWKDPRGVSVEVRRVDLANWALRMSPKLTTGVKYIFHWGFWPDQRSGNPNHIRYYILYVKPLRSKRSKNGFYDIISSTICNMKSTVKTSELSRHLCWPTSRRCCMLSPLLQFANSQIKTYCTYYVIWYIKHLVLTSQYLLEVFPIL